MVNTALTSATAKDHSQCLEMLLKAGADVNVKDKYGYTALARAAKKGHTQCLEILLKAGADVNMSYGYHDTVLVRAVTVQSS